MRREGTLARLKRGGLALDGVRLTGLSPFVTDPDQAATLLDLWRVRFMKGLRPGSVAA